MQQSPSENCVYLAIYDIAKTPHRIPHPMLEDAHYIGRYETPKCFSLYGYGDELAVLLGGDQALDVDIYELNQEQLHTLDDSLNFPTTHDRINLDVPEFGPVSIYVMSEGYATLAHVYDNPITSEQLEKQAVA